MQYLPQGAQTLLSAIWILVPLFVSGPIFYVPGGSLLKSFETLYIGDYFVKGFRGKEAKKVSSDGSGVGLYFVKLICDLHDVRISVSSNRDRLTTIDGITFAPFQVKLEFHHTYTV